MRRSLFLTLVGVSGTILASRAADSDGEARRTGLQALNDFIGVGKGSGGPDKPKLDPEAAIWKEGESLGTTGKKNECIVTGGLGTIAVTYMGETFYVCCTGCRDAFNEEPAKFVKAFKEKKGKSP